MYKGFYTQYFIWSFHDTNCTKQETEMKPLFQFANGDFRFKLLTPKPIITLLLLTNK